jgi:hypothetical protein
MPFINTLNPNAGGVQLAPAMTVTSKTYDSMTLTFTPKGGSTYMVWTNVDRYAQLNFGLVSSGTIALTSLPEDFPVSITLVETTGGVDTYRNKVEITSKVSNCTTSLESSPWAPTWTLSSGYVTQWSDSSGNGNHFVNTDTNATRPTISNGAVLFDTASPATNYLICANTMDYTSPTLVLAVTPLPFFAGNDNSVHAYNLVDTNRVGAATGELSYYLNNDIKTYSGNVATNNVSNGLIYPKFSTLAVSYGSTGWSVSNGFPYYDGFNTGSSSVPNGGKFTLGGLANGAIETGYQGYIHSFKIFSRKLTANEIASLEKSLHLKYNKQI